MYYIRNPNLSRTGKGCKRGRGEGINQEDIFTVHSHLRGGLRRAESSEKRTKERMQERSGRRKRHRLSHGG
jgi:hypothetical protein